MLTTIGIILEKNTKKPFCLCPQSLVGLQANERIGKMSNAYRTLKSSVIEGLSERAHLTGASIEYAHIQVPDIIDAIFHKSVRWAIKEYLAELDTAIESDGRENG
jgi:hypothetical protein